MFGSRCFFFFQNYERRTRQAKPNTTNHATVHTFSHRKMYQPEFSMQFFEFVRPFLRLCVCLSSCSARSSPSVMMKCATAWFNRILFGPFFRGFRRDTSYAVYNASTRMIRRKKYFVFIFSAAHVDSSEGNSGHENGINIFVSFFKRNVQNIVQHSVLKITFCRVELNFSFCIFFNFIFWLPSRNQQQNRENTRIVQYRSVERISSATTTEPSQNERIALFLHRHLIGRARERESQIFFSVSM